MFDIRNQKLTWKDTVKIEDWMEVQITNCNAEKNKEKRR
jgi:hypothetical protein